MSEDNEKQDEGKVYHRKITEVGVFSESLSIEKLYVAAKDTLAASGQYYLTAAEIVQKVVSDGSINPQDAKMLTQTLEDWQKHDNEMQEELENLRMERDIDGVRKIDEEISDYFKNILKKKNLRMPHGIA
jgi:predicted transglutaminase-like protease